MKRLFLFFFFSIWFLYFFSCKKNNDSSHAKIISTWTFKGIIDTGMAFSVSDNITFKYAINGQAKSIALNFYSPVKQSRFFSVADTLTDSTKCTIKIDDGHGQFYYSTGETNDKVTVRLSNYTAKFDFANIRVASATDTQLVSGSLYLPSFY